MFTRFSHAENTRPHQSIYIRGVQTAALRSVNLESGDARVKGAHWRIIAAVERLVGLLLLALSFPALVVAAALLVALSRRSPLVAHQRVGHYGQPIWVLKLRTMWAVPTRTSGFSLVEYVRASDADCRTPKSAKDPRVTNRFAAYCRRFSIDELPQLWHVVRGEMALVGPRPLTRYELNAYYGSDAARVLTRKPGLSGLWQISGRSRLSYAERCDLDLLMIQTWSVPLYCKILIATVPKVLTGKDAW